MAILRVGRSTAYALAREYLRTGGTSGIPCEKVGGLLRFPTAEIEPPAGTMTASIDRSTRWVSDAENGTWRTRSGRSNRAFSDAW
ncbi:hypothetical protein BH20ACT4_BH20ACT4_00360 [soil metagenome]